MIVRPATEIDRPSLRTLYLRARKLGWPWLEDPGWTLADFDEATRDEKIWVADINGRCAGFASVWEQDNFLHTLFVDPDRQGSGIGSALLRHVHTTFTGTGSLKCLVKNDNALRFYQHHGWRSESRGTSPEGDYWLMHFPCANHCK